MKRILFALALLVPSMLPAQVEYQFSNIVNVNDTQIFRTTGTLQFRNTFTYADPADVIMYAFQLNLSDRLKDLCKPGAAERCAFSGGDGYAIGNVQRTNFQANGVPWQYVGSFEGNGCNSLYCENAHWSNISQPFGVLGCNTPATALTTPRFMGRTCAADGFDGWIAVNFRLDILPGNGVNPNVTTADLLPAFYTQAFVAAVVVPEPATWALTAFGLFAVAAARRRTVRAS